MTRQLFVLALGLLLVACIDQKAFLQKFIPKDDDAFARHFIEVVRSGNYDTAKQMLDSSIRGEKATEGLESLHKVIAHGEPLAFEPIGCDVVTSPGSHRTNLSYQIHFPDSWAVGNVYLNCQPNATYVLASHFQQVPDSLEVLNRFSLRGKSALHYAVLAACIAIPALILYALVLCIRTRIKHKWLWIMFILFGVCRLRLNWTSGRFDVQSISFSLFGASAFRASPYAAWIVCCAIPLGAIIFLVRRRKLMSPDERSTTSSVHSDGRR